MSRNLDILVVTESKLDASFPVNQFHMDGYSPPYRVDRTVNGGGGGGGIIYIRDDIPCTLLSAHPSTINLDGIFLEINLNKSKWLLFGSYNPKLENIVNFVKEMGHVLHFYMTKYDNFLLLGDFNSEMNETAMREFSDTYNLENLITKLTCFKNPLNPSLIDLILTNRHRSFQNNKVIEPGLSDHHKLTITVMRAHFLKPTPIAITYRDYKNYDHAQFRYELIENLNNWNGCIMDCETLETVSVAILNRHAPLKKKYTRVNYTKYRNYCTKLFRTVKKKYYNNLDIKLVVENKTFWKTVKPLFSEKHFSNNKITLVKDDEIISTDNEVTETLNRFFTNAVTYLNIDGFKTEYCSNPELDIISNIIDKI